MKICWDNLERLRYNKNTSKWYTKSKTCYVYKESCIVCGEPYLGKLYSDSKFCSLSCANSFNNSGKNNSNYGKFGKDNPFYGKKHTEETRKLLRKHKTGPNNIGWKGGVTKNNLPIYDTYAPQLEWVEDVRRNIDNTDILEVRCARCNKWFVPSRYNVRNRIYKLNKVISGENRFYCSEDCKKACPIYCKQAITLIREDAIKAGRLKWLELDRDVQAELRQLVLERDGYKCSKCGGIENLHCHHIKPVAVEPIESADIDNCVTLCYTCHKEVHKSDGCRYGQLRYEVC